MRVVGRIGNLNRYFYPYFGQNLDCLFGKSTIGQKDFVIRARFFQALPVDSELTNSIVLFFDRSGGESGNKILLQEQK